MPWAQPRRFSTRSGKRSLSELQAICDALPTRFSNALNAAAKLLEPKAQPVTLPGGTIKNEDDLKAWLTSAEEQIREKLKDGPVIIVEAKTCLHSIPNSDPNSKVCARRPAKG